MCLVLLLFKDTPEEAFHVVPTVYTVLSNIIFDCNSRILNKRGMTNNEVASRIQGVGSEEDEEEEGPYATYAMLHTIRKE